MPLKTEKPTLPPRSVQTRINEFIGAVDGIPPQRKQVIDSLTQQKYVKFQIEILENERTEIKTIARRLDMTMNEFIIEAIREKIEKHS
jgi:hypothetical protein